MAYILCVGAAVGVKLYLEHLDTKIAQASAADETERLKTMYNPPWFSKTRYSTSAPTSIWVVANKKNPINPINYQPKNLVTVQGMEVDARIADDLQDLLAAAKADGLDLRIISAYRSYDMQKELFDMYTAQDGQAVAEGYSARPGYSEHQLGLAVDFDNTSGGCTLDGCFGRTAEGLWLADNAHRFGFIVRYEEGMTETTGYIPESWHFRYVGKDLAAEMSRTDTKTLEEFFNIPGGNYVDALDNNSGRNKITNNTY